MSDIDNDKLGALVGKMLGDLGGAFRLLIGGDTEEDIAA